MKKPMKLFACGTTALFAAALTLQAQTSGAGTSGTTGGTTAGSSATSNLGSSSQTMPSSSPQSSQFGTSSATPSTGTSATAPQSSGSQFGSSSANATSSTQIGTAPANPSTPTGANSGFNTSTPNTYGSQSFNATGNVNTSTNANMNSSAATSTTQSTYAAGGVTTVSDSQVTTFVQQYDTLAPDVVVQRVSSDLGDLACSQDTVQNLVQALHDGQSVTITSNVNGQQQSATFNPEGAHMGYGEAYLTLSLAAQELRNAGVTTCATPEQWNAVLMGGPLNVTNTSTTVNSSASASGSRQVQGIVTMRKQGEGWGQIAQANNVQLGQVINANATSQTGAQSGFTNPSTETEQGNVNATGNEDNGSHKGHKKHWWNRDKNKDSHKDSSSTHADDSAKPDNK